MSSFNMTWMCGSSCALTQVVPFDEAAVKRNHELNEMLAKDGQAEKNVIKLLLLGGPESGKSTIFKQMRILHMDGFSESDLMNYKYLVYCNVIQATYQIIDGAKSLFIDYDTNVLEEIENFLEYYKNNTVEDYEITLDLGRTINKIYKSSFANKILNRWHEIALLESAVYFLENIGRIAELQYIPTQQDILRTRAQTTGIVEINFPFKKHTLKLVDVGGQRSERRKWIHCFDNVKSILFVVDISAYTKFDEDSSHQKINRLKESIALYRNILNIVYLKKAVMILFLNKVDIFHDLIKQFSLNICFSNYSGSNTFEEGSKFIEEYFQAITEMSKMQNPLDDNRLLYIHFSTATDTKLIENIFKSCMDSVISHGLSKSGMT